MSESTKTISDSNFDTAVIKSELPVLVDFWAPWCGPCLAIGPTIEELAQEYEGKLVVGKMNVDENANTPTEYGVRSIPFMVLFQNGKMVDSIVGAQPKAKIKELINKAVN
tara:strand:+ start:351 stop:680 length:330 start_codon:yes stop_codon:yes gene_type:complete